MKLPQEILDKIFLNILYSSFIKKTEELQSTYVKKKAEERQKLLRSIETHVLVRRTYYYHLSTTNMFRLLSGIGAMRYTS